MTKSFSWYFYITFYITYQICNITKYKTALQIPAEPLSNITKNNTSIITSLPYLYVHRATLYEKKDTTYHLGQRGYANSKRLNDSGFRSGRKGWRREMVEKWRHRYLTFFFANETIKSNQMCRFWAVIITNMNHFFYGIPKLRQAVAVLPWRHTGLDCNFRDDDNTII